MATIGMQYIHVMMGEDGLVSPRAGYRTCTFYYCQRLATIGMQYAHVPMGEDGLVHTPRGGLGNVEVLLPVDGYHRDAMHACYIA